MASILGHITTQSSLVTPNLSSRDVDAKYVYWILGCGSFSLSFIITKIVLLNALEDFYLLHLLCHFSKAFLFLNL